ncbi:MAG: GLPGLI family protein [Flavobacteriaceae bacterium]|jgi:GLPGLI family protein|nr:GLPGLI family protein [Flavobacteriaceae bacterium]
MKNFKKIILILTVFPLWGTGGLKLFSQTHRFFYEMQMKLGDQTEKMNMVLDIDKDFVKFYDYDFIMYDSISKKNGSLTQTNTISDQLILRKRNTFENKSFHDNEFDYFVIESEDEMNWKLEPEIKTVEEYRLQKATTNFGGRHWTAWFCNDIPFQEGPYKFRGLPGLIFELNDDKNDFVYSLIKSINLPKTFDTSHFLETHYGNQPISVTLKQYHKVKLDYYNDPYTKTKSELKELLENGGSLTIGGEKIIRPEQLDQKRKQMQQWIKEDYNPIESDKAIPYPD